jgi:hypothetical protein
MSSVDPIFRQEALDFRARGRTREGGVIRLGGRWLRLLYWVTLLFVVAGGTALWFIRTDEQATGPAVVDSRDGSVVALLPLAVAPQLSHAEGLAVRLNGTSVGVTVSSAQPVDAAGIRRAGLAGTAEAGILLRGRVHPARHSPLDASGKVRARAVVVLRSERAVDVLTRRFRVMLGERGGQ